MNRKQLGVTMLGLLISMPAAVAADQPTPLQKSLGDLSVHSSWIYNDLGAGFAQSKKTGKPLLVVFR